MIKKFYLAIAMLLAMLGSSTNAFADNDSPAAPSAAIVPTQGVITAVEGTDLARLQRAVDVLMQIPNVEITDNDVRVTGRGHAAVYIGKRCVVNLSDLWILPASRIQDIAVNAAPDAIYGRDVQAVIVITLIRDMEEGLKVDNSLRFDLNSRLSVSNRLALGYRYKNINITSLIALDQKREHVHKTEFEQNYAHSASDEFLLKSRIQTITQPNNHIRTVTARIGIDYDIASNHQAHLSYTTYQTLVNKSRDNNARRLEYAADAAGVLDLEHTTADLAQMNRQRTPEQHHDLAAEYQGKAGKWKIYAGHNSIWQIRNNFAKTYRPVPVMCDDEYFLRHELKMRNYLQTAVPLFYGTLQFGGEHQYRHNNVSLVNRCNTSVGRIHGAKDATTLAAYANVSHKIGIAEFDAGIRYESVDFRYKALPDDENLQNSALTSFRYSISDDLLYPSAGLKLNLSDKSHIALRYTRTKNSPDMSNIRVIVTDAPSPLDYMLYVERISTTSLSWQYDWLTLSTAYKHYSDPLFNTTDGKVDFTGKCYSGIDLGIDLCPTIGIWKPALSLHCHKQWLNMQLANGKKHANKPIHTLQFNNTVSTKSNWMFRLNAKYRSQGYDRNIRYLDHNFQLDASVTKTLCNNQLTIEASLENMLRNSWDDVSMYGNWKTLQSKGYRQRMPRTFTVSLRYIL